MSAGQLPYRTVEVSPLTKKQLKWSEYRKVPVALLDGEIVTDSTAIITRLAAEIAGQEQQEQQQQQKSHGYLSLSGWRNLIGGGRRRGEVGGAEATISSDILLFGSDSHHVTDCSRHVVQASGNSSLDHSEQADEEEWRRWVDERLVRLLTVNIYRNMRESYQTFDYITASSCNFGFFEREAARVVGAVMMWGISGRLKKKYGIEGDVREELYQAANKWTEALGDQRYSPQQTEHLHVCIFCARITCGE